MKPTEINLHQRSRVLEITFEDGAHFKMPVEYLRVYSPSAEVQGHGPGQEVLQIGKEDVNIERIEPIGHYAVQAGFRRQPRQRAVQLGLSLRTRRHAYDDRWQDYLDRLEAGGHKRRPDPADVIIPPGFTRGIGSARFELSARASCLRTAPGD